MSIFLVGSRLLAGLALAGLLLAAVGCANPGDGKPTPAATGAGPTKGTGAKPPNPDIG